MPVEDFRHQGVDRASAGGNCMQNIRTIGFALNRALDGFDLAANPTDPIQHPLLIANNMGQALLPLMKDSIPRQVYRGEAVWRSGCVQTNGSGVA